MGQPTAPVCIDESSSGSTKLMSDRRRAWIRGAAVVT